jgi:glycosyltransferase A (GT-A) superfamily protein (DUF2064 family)
MAAAALADTLAAAAAVPDVRRVVVLDGSVGAWLPGRGFEVLPQRGVGLAARLGAAFEDVGGPALLIGMDTPHVTSGMLEEALERLLEPRVDAVLGPAEDGGYWTIGLREADPRAFEGVPMSDSRTGVAQRERLAALGLDARELPVLRDVDSFADAVAVAALAPSSRFAGALGRMEADAEAVGR